MARDDDNYRSSRDSRPSRDDDRPSRDRDDRGSSRGWDRDDDRGRSASPRDDDRGGRGRDRDQGGGRSSGYTYQKRDDADAARRAAGNSKFDKYLNPDIKLFKPREGMNVIRILPPTWKGARHYGYDIWTHFGVGADEQTYLCLAKMKDDANAYFERMKLPLCDGTDPIEEEVRQLQRDGFEDEAKKAKHKLRVGIYLIDRNNERDGVQFWLMGEQNDREIVQQSMGKSGAALAIDDPDEGYDVSFHRKGTGQTTKYTGVSVDRDPSRLGKDEWLRWAVDHPIPEQLIFYPYDHLKNALGGGGGHSSRHDRDARDSRDADPGRDRERNDRGRDRDDGRSERDTGRASSRDSRDDTRGRGEDRSRDGASSSSRDAERGVERSRDSGRGRDDTPTFESIHDMSRRELEDLIDVERLDIKPREAKDDADLADWICEEMKLKTSQRSSRDEAPREGRRNMEGDAGDEGRDRLRSMREERDRR